jgi:hypothetical protein
MRRDCSVTDGASQLFAKKSPVFPWILFLDSTRRLFGYFCPRQVCTFENRFSPERRSANRIA